MSADQMIATLKLHADAQVVQRMAKFGIKSGQALGITVPTLRKLARANGKDQELAVALWDSGIHEARILASMVAEPHLVSPQLMDRWVNDFDSWDVCDQVCGNLFDKTPFAYQKAMQWCHEEKEFVRRADFVMIAELAVHDEEASDEAFLPFFLLIRQYAWDERNFVKKAINWALRQMGKRNQHLCAIALECANELEGMDYRAAKWIAKDALVELRARVDKD
ncbi:MAG TPA: DNA alkylation repair protein [Ktedonobacteraceae bacterium]|nr:DNA alkylation repair protein [Ktedonobacteraceae bacterium]